MSTVQRLRNDGYRVSVSHYRLLAGHGDDLRHQAWFKETGYDPAPRGGGTFVVITDTDGTTATAYSMCSLKDNYNKKVGREIAIGRALKKLREGGDTF